MVLFFLTHFDTQKSIFCIMQFKNSILSLFHLFCTYNVFHQDIIRSTSYNILVSLREDSQINFVHKKCCMDIRARALEGVLLWTFLLSLKKTLMHKAFKNPRILYFIYFGTSSIEHGGTNTVYHMVVPDQFSPYGGYWHTFTT